MVVVMALKVDTVVNVMVNVIVVKVVLPQCHAIDSRKAKLYQDLLRQLGKNRPVMLWRARPGIGHIGTLWWSRHPQRIYLWLLEHLNPISVSPA